MILHSVYCALRKDADHEAFFDVFQALEQLCATLDGVMSFEGGPNKDFEKKSQAFPFGFVIRFSDADALARYAQHPAHRVLGAQLCTFCDGGAAGIMVFDLEV